MANDLPVLITSGCLELKSKARRDASELWMLVDDQLRQPLLHGNGHELRTGSESCKLTDIDG